MHPLSSHSTVGGARGAFGGRRWLARIGLGAALALSAPLAMAASCETVDPDKAQNLVRVTTTEFFAAVDRDRETIRSEPMHVRELVDAIIAPHVDLDRFARLVLGKHWREATTEQREQFKQEFRVLIVRTYASAVADLPDIEVKYLPLRESKREDLVTVRTAIPLSDGKDFSVNYRLLCRDDAWKVFDVTIEGVSMVTTYRNAFRAEVRQVGLDGLIEKLASKNREQLSATGAGSESG